MEEALAAIRQAITKEEAGETTLAPAEPRTLREQAGAKRTPEAGLLSHEATAAIGLCVQHADGNCKEARADARGCCSRSASSDAEVVAGRKLAPRGRADGAGRVERITRGR